MAIPDSARVTNDKIVTQPFANLFNLINNRSNVIDPNNDDGTRKFVYERLPRFGRNFKGFPFIVVERAMPSKNKNLVSLEKAFMSYDFTVTVFCQDDESDGLGNPKGAAQCNDITDDIIETLNNISNRKTLINQGMANLRFDVDISDEEDLKGKLVFTSEFDIRFEQTLTIVG